MTARWVLLLLLCATTVHADRRPYCHSAFLRKAEAAQAPAAGTQSGAVDQIARQRGRAELRAAISSQVSLVTLNPSPASSQTNKLQIHGSGEFQERINRPLNLLKEKDPEAYGIVLNNLDLMTESSRWTCVDVDKRVTYFNLRDTVDVFWCPSGLVHEAMHVVYSQNNILSWGTAAELFSIARQHKSLLKIGAPSWMSSYVAALDGTHWMQSR